MSAFQREVLTHEKTPTSRIEGAIAAPRTRPPDVGVPRGRPGPGVNKDTKRHTPSRPRIPRLRATERQAQRGLRPLLRFPHTLQRGRGSHQAFN